MTRDWLREHRYELLAGLIASVPIVVGTARALSFDWTATVDDGMVAVRSFDVLTAKFPLVGNYSAASDFSGGLTYSLGPLQYWVLAVPARFGSTALIVTTALVNVACVLATLVLARRRGGLPLMFGLALGIALMSRSLPPESLYDLLPPWAALFPFTLLLMLAWSVACGDRALVPLLILVASFIVQAHLTLLLPVAGVVALALTVVVVSALREKRGRPADTPPAGPEGSQRSWRRPVVAALVVGAVCWTAPAIDQAIHRPGNFVLAARAATNDRETLGSKAGVRATVRAVGVVPWWVRDPRNPFVRVIDVSRNPSVLMLGSALLVIGAGLVILLAAARQGRTDIAVAAALSLWLCLAVALVTSSLPSYERTTGLMRYSLSWASPAGMWVWVTLGWSVVTLILAGRTQRATPTDGDAARAPAPLFVPRLAVAALGLVAVASVWTASSSVARQEQDFATIGAAAERVKQELPSGQTVLMETTPEGGFLAGDYLPPITYALRREGTEVMAPPTYARQLGASYRIVPNASEWTVGLHEDPLPLRRGERVIFEVPDGGRITLLQASRRVGPRARRGRVRPGS